MAASDTLSTTLSALADPTRRAIIARLTEREMTVKELSEPFAMSGPAISKHLRVLETAGLISRGRDGQSRPCRLVAEPIREVLAWAGGYERFWTESFARLDQHLETMKAREADDANDA
jgi:DNA-binding transcriptional ArsR family regulator